MNIARRLERLEAAARKQTPKPPQVEIGRPDFESDEFLALPMREQLRQIREAERIAGVVSAEFDSVEFLALPITEQLRQLREAETLLKQ